MWRLVRMVSPLLGLLWNKSNFTIVCFFQCGLKLFIDYQSFNTESIGFNMNWRVIWFMIPYTWSHLGSTNIMSQRSARVRVFTTQLTPRIWLRFLQKYRCSCEQSHYKSPRLQNQEYFYLWKHWILSVFFPITSSLMDFLIKSLLITESGAVRDWKSDVWDRN